MTTSALAETIATTSGSDDAAVPAVSSQSPAGNRPQFTITDAAAACAVSRKTITRKLPELSSFGAAKDGEGVWRIPVEALLAAGLHPGRSVSGQDVARPEARAAKQSSSGTAAPSAPSIARTAVPAATAADVPADPDVVTISRQRWDDLRIRLARAEAEASERSLALADARLALRALTAGPAVPAMAYPTDPTRVGPHASGSLGQGSVVGQPSPMTPGQTPQAAAMVRRRRWWHWS